MLTKNDNQGNTMWNTLLCIYVFKFHFMYKKPDFLTGGGEN